MVLGIGCLYYIGVEVIFKSLILVGSVKLILVIFLNFYFRFLSLFLFVVVISLDYIFGFWRAKGDSFVFLV